MNQGHDCKLRMWIIELSRGNLRLSFDWFNTWYWSYLSKSFTAHWIFVEKTNTWKGWNLQAGTATVMGYKMPCISVLNQLPVSIVSDWSQRLFFSKQVCKWKLLRKTVIRLNQWYLLQKKSFPLILVGHGSPWPQWDLRERTHTMCLTTRRMGKNEVFSLLLQIKQ